MRKYDAFQKILAIALTIMLVVGMAPHFTVPAQAATQGQLEITDKVSDPETLNNWQDYYGTNSILPDGSRGISTWKAGGVWTDKSVFSTQEQIDAAGLGDKVTLSNDNHFLVTLSALASNQEIVGQSSTPTDTMLVLDLSESMDTSESVGTMINAANDTLRELLEMNMNNRVGVVLYSGNSSFGDSTKSTATVILPLDYYTTTTTTTDWEYVDGGWTSVTKYQYLSVSGDDDDTTVSVAEGTRNSNDERPTGSKVTTGGTYIQNGLYQAYEEFTSTADKGVVQTGEQAGVQRQPIMILMSDGAPTVATESYSNVGRSDVGNGGSTTNEIIFLTQLTAAWVKGAVKSHYNNTAVKFYTLGLGTSNNANATSVLYPAGMTSTTINGWWENFLSNPERTDGTVEIQEEVEGSGRPGRPNYVPSQDGWYLTFDENGYATGVGKNYVDRYWAAADADSMIDAFEQIVKEIGLQSAYSATLVESGEADLDGYITVQDELGSMMHIKGVKGILLGDQLFSGAEMAKSMNEGLLGQSSNPKEYGSIFVNTVKERLNIEDTSVVQDLIRNAYHTGQLKYVSDTEYSNYIGWYGDENNTYMGFWHESYGMDAESAPAGAKYLNKCYLYLGGTAGSEGSADMMHVVVQTRMEIATGHQAMRFRVPSSLIPMITYRVELDTVSLESATDITVEVEENEPIRLLYEVGLPTGVNSLNIDQKVEEYLAREGSNHIHKDGSGKYVFYANSWGADHDDNAPAIENMTDEEKLALTDKVAESHFVPNTANERFYIQEDTPVYVKVGNSYVPASGMPQAGTTYYFTRTIVTVVNGTPQAVTQYEALYPETVKNSANFQQNSEGVWQIKAGTPRQTLSELGLAKTENATDTIATSDQLWVYISGSEATDHNVYSFLGNNGRMRLSPATGIQVTKEVTELADGAAADEKFELRVLLDMAYSAEAVAALSVSDTEGYVFDSSLYTISESDGKILVSVYLAAGESAIILGMPAAVDYTVTEAPHEKYSYTYTGASQTVAYTIVEGVVTNDPVKPGSLYITKEVKHAAAGEAFPTDTEFEFEVTFVDVKGEPIANTEFALVNNYDPSITARTTDENGVMVGWLRHGETVHIQNIPAGATVTVEEVKIPENYTSTEYRSLDFSGDTADNDGVVTIQSQQNATVVVTNTYTPKSTTVELDIEGTKIFEVQDSSSQHGGSFTFLVEKWDGSVWVEVENKTVTLDYEAGTGSNTKTFTIEDVLEGVTFDKAGVYAYQVREKIGTVANVTYDRTLYTFTVTVTDVNGQLVATVTDLNNALIEDGSYETTFRNSYHNVAVSIDMRKNVVDTSNNTLTSPAGFKFMVQEAEIDAAGQWVVKDGGTTSEIFTDGAGEARFAAMYKEAGTYYFIVSEHNEGKPGWDYTTQQYQVEIVVTEDPVTEDLTATVLIDGVDQQSDEAQLTFTNTYDPADGELDLNVLVKKSLNGRALKEGEFTFAIFKDGAAVIENGAVTNLSDALATGTNDAAGNVTFTPGKLTFETVGSYAYDIVEVKGALGGVSYDPVIYDLVVDVADNGDGTLKATYYFEDSPEKQITFVNTYTTTPTQVVIEGLKVIEVESGVKILTAGEFTFGLYATDDSGNIVGDPIQTTTNLANGIFKFSPIQYTGNDIGKTYTYVIKEIAPDGTTDGSYTSGGLEYSGQAYTVTVTIVDNGNGTLSAQVVGNGSDTIEFVNNYSSNPVSVSLEGTKTLDGRTLTAGEFRYALYGSDKDFTTRTLITDTLTHDGDGKINIGLGTLGMGYHYYVLKEVIPEERAAGILYDASEYHITVQVIDKGNGQMSALTSVYHPGMPNAVNPAIAFNNIYKPEDGELILSGSKNYLGGKALSDDVFSVGLYDDQGQLLQTAYVKADGTYTFEAIPYTADDVGKTYTYTVKEIIPDGAADNGDGTFTSGNDIYDGTVYTVKVTITDDDKDGALEIAKEVTGGNATVELAFTNTFVPDPVEYELQAHKTYEKGLKGNDFKFKLSSADDETDIEQVKFNDADGNVSFDPIVFPEAGTYTFHVEEIDKILGFIEYSTAKYLVTIEVVNNNGVLQVVEPITVTNLTDNADGDLTFVNTYVLDGEGEVTLRGNKILTGDRTTVEAGEFSFGLYDETGKLVETVTNNGNGEFVFTTLHFDQTDVPVNGQKQYTYTVKEIAGSNARYTYDDTVYTVVITVKDNDEGGIDVSYTINGKASDQIAITFTNTYTNPTPVTYTPEAVKKYNKDLVGGEFTFKLEGEIGDQEISQTKKNDADGKVTFDTLSFPEAGTYTFKVTEIEKLLGFINYSAAEHEIIVKVIDTKGVLSIESVTINGDADGTIEFVNTYFLDGEGEITLRGTKAVTGDRTTLTSGEFEFGLYDAEGKLVEAVKNDADGNFVFATLKFDETDVPVNGQKQITYTIKEIPGSDPCMAYDPTVYTVVVTVKDNDQGGVDVSYTVNGQADGKIAFTNTYTAPADVLANIYIQKKVINKTQNGIGLNDFTFVLEHGTATYTDVSDAEGKAGFQITLGAKDIGQTYEFKVSEKRGNTPGVTYDSTVYTVIVKVEQNPDGTIKTIINDQVTNGIELEFTNIYEKPQTPVTGDDFPLYTLGALLVISGAALVVLILSKKRKPGKYAA